MAAMRAPRVFTAAVPLACDVCSERASPVRKVLRFALTRWVAGPTGQRGTTRGVGSLFLCEPCWRVTAGQRRRQYGPNVVGVVGARKAGQPALWSEKRRKAAAVRMRRYWSDTRRREWQSDKLRTVRAERGGNWRRAAVPV